MVDINNIPDELLSLILSYACHSEEVDLSHFKAQISGPRYKYHNDVYHRRLKPLALQISLVTSRWRDIAHRKSNSRFWIAGIRLYRMGFFGTPTVNNNDIALARDILLTSMGCDLEIDIETPTFTLNMAEQTEMLGRQYRIWMHAIRMLAKYHRQWFRISFACAWPPLTSLFRWTLKECEDLSNLQQFLLNDNYSTFWGELDTSPTFQLLLPTDEIQQPFRFNDLIGLRHLKLHRAPATTNMQLPDGLQTLSFCDMHNLQADLNFLLTALERAEHLTFLYIDVFSDFAATFQSTGSSVLNLHQLEQLVISSPANLGFTLLKAMRFEFLAKLTLSISSSEGPTWYLVEQINLPHLVELSVHFEEKCYLYLGVLFNHLNAPELLKLDVSTGTDVAATEEEMTAMNSICTSPTAIRFRAPPAVTMRRLGIHMVFQLLSSMEYSSIETLELMDLSLPNPIDYGMDYQVPFPRLTVLRLTMESWACISHYQVACMYFRRMHTPILTHLEVVPAYEFEDPSCFFHPIEIEYLCAKFSHNLTHLISATLSVGVHYPGEEEFAERPVGRSLIVEELCLTIDLHCLEVVEELLLYDNKTAAPFWDSLKTLTIKMMCNMYETIHLAETARRRLEHVLTHVEMSWTPLGRKFSWAQKPSSNTSIEYLATCH